LGRYLSSGQLLDGDVEAGDIQIKARYDYEAELGSGLSGYKDLMRWTANAGPTTVGDVAEQTITPHALQVDFRPSRQKIQSVQFEIEEVATADGDGLTYALGRGFEFVAVDLEVGTKVGSTRRLDDTRKR